MQTYDIAIIGNGILGLSTAFALLRESPNLKIVILGPMSRPSSATLAAGAMLGCYGEVTASWQKCAISNRKHQLLIKAKNMWPAWLAEINQRHAKRMQLSISYGTHILLNAKSGRLDDQNFNAIIQALKASGEPYQDVCEISNIPGLSPMAHCRPLKALHIPNEGSIAPMKLLLVLEKSILHYPNVSLLNDKAEIINHRHYRVNTIKTTRGNQISADVVVLAAGAYTQPLIDQLPEISSNIPKILSGVGCGITLRHDEKCATSVIRTPNRGAACGLVLVPRGNNISYIGASNFTASIPESKGRVRYYYYLLQNAVDQLNQTFHNARVTQWHLGNRPVSIDTYPLIGPTQISNLYLATGTYRDGIHLSPLIATDLAHCILQQSSMTESAFLPERAPIEHFNMQDAIDDYVTQVISVGFEHGINLPKIGWNKLFEDTIRAHVTHLYQKLDVEFGIPCEILQFLLRNPTQIPLFRRYYQRAKAMTCSSIAEPVI